METKDFRNAKSLYGSENLEVLLIESGYRLQLRCRSKTVEVIQVKGVTGSRQRKRK